jgi:hypothetical protein
MRSSLLHDNAAQLSRARSKSHLPKSEPDARKKKEPLPPVVFEDSGYWFWSFSTPDGIAIGA